MKYKPRILYKLFIYFFCLLIASNALLPAAIVLAEEATPSAEISVIPTPEPIAVTPTPEATPSAIPTVTLTPTSVPIASDWKDNGDGSFQTVDNIVLDKEYIAVQNSKVKIKFNKLPSPSGKIAVKEIKLSAEQLKQTKALSDTAYDISSTMENGTFEYTLTLPAPVTENIEVKASEDGETFVTVGGVTAQSDRVIITGLNHFTLFVLVPTGTAGDAISDSYDTSVADTYLTQASADKNFGGDVTGEIKPVAGDYRRFLIKFDLSPITEESTVTNATLKLFMTTAPNVAQTLEAYGITSDWAEGIGTWSKDNANWNNKTTGVVWTSPGGDFTGSAVSTNTGTNAGVWLSWDVTSLVQSWYSGSPANYGFIIKNANEGTGDTNKKVLVATRENLIPENRPRLEVTFTPPASSNEFPSITVTSPDGGEILAGGDTRNITWTASDPDVSDTLTVNLEYSTDDSTYTPIANGLSNSGTYSWSIPDIDFSTVIIRATVSDGTASASDVSNSNFTIDSTPPTILYNYPVAGGVTGWYLSDPGSVINIDFLSNGGSLLDHANKKIGNGSWTTIFNTGQASYLNNWAINWASLSEGENQISLKVVDLAGNEKIDNYTFGISGFLFRKHTFSPDSVFVDDDFSDASSGGHEYGYDAFSTIQAGINAVSSGGTVDIAAGTYDEAISIGKNLTLTGADNNTVIKKSGGVAITVSTGNVTISHIKLSGSNTGLNVTGGNVVIRDSEILGNSISGITAGSGISVTAVKNFWGAASGPYHATSNISGTGDVISNGVSYRQFYTNAERTVLSSSIIIPADLPSLLTSGIFTIPESYSSTDTPTVTLAEDLAINVTHGSGMSTINLPTGTVITRSDGSNLNVNNLTSSAINADSLSGLGSGVTIHGALQWGVPNIGLAFSAPITLNIYVGTALNGQTLNVQRSTSGADGWTSEGIVAPATCLVSEGICSFQATQASYYATTETTSSDLGGSSSNNSGSSGGGDGLSDGLGCATRDCSVHPVIAWQTQISNPVTSTTGFQSNVLGALIDNTALFSEPSDSSDSETITPSPIAGEVKGTASATNTDNWRLLFFGVGGLALLYWFAKHKQSY